MESKNNRGLWLEVHRLAITVLLSSIGMICVVRLIQHSAYFQKLSKQVYASNAALGFYSDIFPQKSLYLISLNLSTAASWGVRRPTHDRYGESDRHLITCGTPGNWIDCGNWLTSTACEQINV